MCGLEKGYGDSGLRGVAALLSCQLVGNYYSKAQFRWDEENNVIFSGHRRALAKDWQVLVECFDWMAVSTPAVMKQLWRRTQTRILLIKINNDK